MTKQAGSAPLATPQKAQISKPKKKKPRQAMSYKDQDTTAEMLYDPVAKTTAFAVATATGISIEPFITTPSSQRILPYPPTHPFVEKAVVRLPEKPESYDRVETLTASIRRYIHRFVDVSATFETIATHYVLLSWLYDTYKELGYLRIRGDFGSGKTRFLTVIGNLCYKAMFASGAATVAPLFHMLDEIGGTLIMDESDFIHSNEKSLIAKILNNGNAVGFPVLRCERKRDQSMITRSYSVFGPKVLASRGRFEDNALESRFLNEDAGIRALRADIPLDMGEEAEAEALQLRNQLLQFRLDRLREAAIQPQIAISGISPRMRQIVRPLLQFMNTIERAEVLDWAMREEQQQKRDRGMELPSHILIVLRTLLTHHKFVSMGEIGKGIERQFGEYYEFPPTAKAIGASVRTVLQLRTRRMGGRFVVTRAEQDKIELLASRYGL